MSPQYFKFFLQCPSQSTIGVAIPFAAQNDKITLHKIKNSGKKLSHFLSYGGYFCHIAEWGHCNPMVYWGRHSKNLNIEGDIAKKMVVRRG
jgi:hypothetical protein